MKTIKDIFRAIILSAVFLFILFLASKFYGDDVPCSLVCPGDTVSIIIGDLGFPKMWDGYKGEVLSVSMDGAILSIWIPKLKKRYTPDYPFPLQMLKVEGN